MNPLPTTRRNLLLPLFLALFLVAPGAGKVSGQDAPPGETGLLPHEIALTGPSGPAVSAEAEPAPDASAIPRIPPVPPIPPIPPVPRKDSTAIGASITVDEGETHEGDIVVTAGSATIRGNQNGDVVVLGGAAEISGTVEGDVVVTGGTLILRSGARVTGDAVCVVGRLEKEEGATVEGDIVNPVGAVPQMRWMGPEVFFPIFFGWMFGLALWEWIAHAIIAAVLVVAIASLAPMRVEAAAPWMRANWLRACATGLVAWILLVAIGVILCCTIAVPIAAFLFYQAAKFFGLTVFLLVLGQGLARAIFKREVGMLAAVLLGLVLVAVVGLFSPIWFLLGMFGVGISLGTKFGSLQPWSPRRNGRTGAPPVPAEPPVPGPQGTEPPGTAPTL